MAENVGLTRHAFQAFDDRDLDALLALLDDRVEAFPILAGMEGGSAWHVSRFRGGKCIGWHVYTSEREALEAVGLLE